MTFEPRRTESQRDLRRRPRSRARSGAAAYLDDACRDDAELRLRVDVLLRAHERAGEILGPIGKPGVDVSTEARTTDPLATANPLRRWPPISDADGGRRHGGRNLWCRTGSPEARTIAETGGAVGNGLQRGDTFVTLAITRSTTS